MNRQTSASSTPQVAGEYASSPYDAPPAWVPTPPTTFAAPVTSPRRGLRDRMAAFRRQVVKLWAALAVGAACLVVGLGLGALIGHEIADTGSSTVQQQPGTGTGQLPGQDGAGPGFGRHGFDGQGFGQGPGTQPDGQSGTQPGGQSGTTGSGTAS